MSARGLETRPPLSSHPLWHVSTALDLVLRYALNTPTSQSDWTTTHGFFILMGGFHEYDGEKPLTSLHPRHVLHLIRYGLITPPSEEEIKDRGKSNIFAKIIVVVQTSWFVMQCIARHIEHLPITELEIATAAYTLMTLGIYLCWWNKPLGVTQPICIQQYVWDNPSWMDTQQESMWERFEAALTGSFFQSSHLPAISNRRT